MKNLSKFGGAAVSALALATSAGFAAPFTAGSIVVVRLGDGAALLSAASAAAFLEERDANDGHLIQPAIALPATFSVAGSSTSEGFLTLSANGQYLVLAGYNAPPGTAAIASTPASTTSRVIARVDLNGNIDVSTQLNDASGNPRSAASDDGSRFWLSSNSVGVRYATLGTVGPSVQITAAPTNVRVMNVFNGQLYLSTGSAGFQGVSSVGSGLPTTSGETTTNLPGMPATASAYDYFFSDASTLYIADDRSAASGGGVQKWTLSAGTWNLGYTIPLGTSGVGARGLTGRVSGGTTTLWATSAAGTTPPNSVYTAIDSGPATNASLMAATTTGTNMILRGIRVLPPPVTTTGSCCLPAGSCVVVSSAACAAQGGVYGGNNSPCGSCPQPGACCSPDGSCDILSSAQCASQGGVYGGNGSVCGSCPQPGGCCLPSGICLIRSSGQCTAAGGTFAGNGNPCPTACAAARTGACCATNGTCSTVTSASCTGSGGTFRGDGTSCATATCGTFGAANLVVFEASSAAATATPVVLREIRISDGATVQAIGLPTVASENGNRSATIRGSSSTEGEMTLSTDGHYLVMMGYNMDSGGADPTGSTVSRVAVRVDASGKVNTTTAFTDHTFEGSSPRGAASVDGSAFWLSGASFPDLANEGIRYATLGASSSVQLNTDAPNTRDILIFSGKLFYTTSTAIAQLGTGLPTSGTNASAPFSLLGPPLPDSLQGFFFSDSTTLYLAGNAASTLNGVRKFTFDGTDWNAQYQMDGGGTILHPIQQLTGKVVGGVVTLYGTEALGGNGASGPGNTLYKIVDDGTANSPYTPIATASATATWKGVAFAPTPATVSCYPNCDNSTAAPILNVADFTCFLQKFAAGNPYANCDNSTSAPVLNVADFTCFLQKYAAGCP